ncbi:BlaI/MecI/CopY family transcriptional regulator [Clostridium sp. MD294]|uniref:BlaI/MecI/CopY family transcriptional regulator n=1 Tax=Clostridium sp. MD294 TaxID=97138 RepID=UPI0002C902B5|nr:BlaI/MecI/CopY family transcriptional regulator [Clostridium sp. MD294]NDO47691.1 BlaI/MecI/CopY family transcriptional regulator [Clostridium sp. MD294]USF29992.1 hypothetical protein C820_001415 [Clostridium sp. MD294]
MSNKSKSKYNLSATEIEIMEYIWSTDKKLIAAEILNYFNENKSKNWKKQTLNTFLVKLIEKGTLQYDVSKNKKYYYPTPQSQTKTEHIKHWTQNFIQNTFDGSLYHFLYAFTGGSTLSKNHADELKKYLEEENNIS